METLPIISSPGSGFFPSPLRPKLRRGHQASFSPSPKAPSRRPISVCDPCRKRLALFPISIFALLFSSEILYIYNTLLHITVKPFNSLVSFLISVTLKGLMSAFRNGFAPVKIFVVLNTASPSDCVRFPRRTGRNV
jgi:hypothetical protein